MNIHRSLITLSRIALALAVAVIGLAANAQPSRAATQAPAAVGASLPKIRIADTLTNPASGPEWVELSVDESLTHRTFLPVIMRPLPPPPTFEVGTPPIPAGATGLSIGGWELSNDAGVNYVVPAALPPLPVGTHVRIVFDGAGATADDYDLSDGLITLHSLTGMLNVFDNSNSQVSIYSSSDHTSATLRAHLALAVLGG